jgi:hypothetical protein
MPPTTRAEIVPMALTACTNSRNVIGGVVRYFGG